MLYVSIIIFSALLYTYYHFRDRVPILMYHRIASVPGDRNALPEEKFEEQMRYLEENGFHSITVDELQAHFLHGKRLPKKPVVLTFDDGYEDNFSAALPTCGKCISHCQLDRQGEQMGKFRKSADADNE